VVKNASIHIYVYIWRVQRSHTSLIVVQQFYTSLTVVQLASTRRTGTTETAGRKERGQWYENYTNRPTNTDSFKKEKVTSEAKR